MTQQRPIQTTPTRLAPFAWCGWSLSVPAKWRPVKVAGDATKGSVLFADLDRPRLGLRWETPPEKRVLTGGEADWLVDDLLRREVGRLAADEAVDCGAATGDWPAARLYVEPEPPGRDVFVGVSRTSRRVVELVCHTRRRDRLLEDLLLPSLHDAAEDEPRDWAIFDLAVTTPPGYAMQSHTLSAGDLRLALARRSGRATLPLVVRQVRPARLALSRQPLEVWLSRFVAEATRFHRPLGIAAATEVAVGDAAAAGLHQVLVRRRRYRWLWSVPPRLHAAALHDAAADRLLLLRSADAGTLRAVAASLSSAAGGAG